MYYYGTAREICIGDRVEMVGRCDSINFDYESRENGTLYATIRTFLGPHECGVEFDRRVLCAHDLSGLTERGRGYYVCYRNLKFVGDSTPGAVRCRNCGEVISAPSVLASRLYKNTPMCDKCVCETIGVVHGYHFAKGLRYDVDPDRITCGAEIEIDADYNDGADRREFVKECVKYARDNKYPLFMSYETDGSLNDDGVECVTAPLTLRDWKDESVKNQLDFMFNNAEDFGFNFSKNNHAGLHIHIGRKSLCGDDREVSDAIGLLMGWAVTRLWNNGFKKLAGRDTNRYCKGYDRDGDGKGLKDTGAVCDRYYFVNIQNSKTLELRVFNRATCYEDVLLAIDTCYMLAKWATKKINAYLKRNSYSAKSRDFTDALSYADRLDWSALVKFSKYPEITLRRMRAVGIDV